MEQMQVFAGLDMHQDTTTGTITDDAGNRIRVLEVETSKDGIAKLFDRISKKHIKAVFEASRNWPYFHELIAPHCNEIIMAHPTRIKAIASARIKTDTIDSGILSDLLRANLIPESYMPPFEIVQLKELLRYRAYLSKQRGSYKCKVRSILSREGKKCEFSDVTSREARLWIKHTVLNDLNRKELDYVLGLVDNLSSEIKKLDKIIDKQQYLYPEIEILKSVPGINTYSALLIFAEIGDFTRFPSPDKLASYAGIIPSTHQSGDSCYNGAIIRRGSAYLRWILTQCSHACLKTKRTHRLKRFYCRLAKRRGKKKAIVATSGKMLTTIWHLIYKNEYYAY